jgi:hypothetical protein
MAFDRRRHFERPPPRIARGCAVRAGRGAHVSNLVSDHDQ